MICFSSRRSPSRWIPLLLLSWLIAPAAMAQETVAAVESADIGLDPMAERYQLGNGLKLGNSGFTLGGYGEATYADPQDEPAEGAIDALSLLLWWDGGGRWHFFSELELEHAVIFRRGDTTTDDARLVSERIYADYVRTDALKFRIGKFLTPVGRWNLIHAAPLTWTTSRPLITEATFPTNATGAMVYGVLPWTAEGVEYSLYVSPGEEIFPEPGLDTFAEAVGGRLAATLLPNVQFGFSYVNFEQEKAPDERKHLFGVDFGWNWRRFELSGEFAYRTIARNSDTRDEEGLYVQLVAPLTQRLYAVGRYEAFHASAPDRDLTLYLGGLNFRYKPALVFKAEFVQTTDDEFDLPDGFLASFAVLF